MPGDLYVGGGVYVYLPVITDTYWPVDGVTKPQHLWPFSQTGDYTDQGSTGGLGLTAQGSGNSFSSDGLVLNGSGWAMLDTTNDDINNIGSTWSILVDFYYPTYKTWECLLGVTNNVAANSSWEVDKVNYNSVIYLYTPTAISVIATNSLPTQPAWYQIVCIRAGTDVTIYVNGEYCINLGKAAPQTSTLNFTVGAQYGGGYKLTGTVKRAAVLKGTAWSADDVAAIYAALP